MSTLARIRGRLTRAPRPPEELTDAPSDEALARARDRYAGRGAGPRLGFGTVADLADSREHLGWLAGTSFDMKSLQRCWALKEILATVEPPGPLLEIGAGEPFVASALARLGYQVTIVDPYDGSGTGPVELDEFRRRFPELRFVRDHYPSAEAADQQAAVYSISVLEHVPLELAGEAASAARAQGARNIHAIDHVLRGWGDAEHQRRLEEMCSALGLERRELADALALAEQDPETYLVSAESHEIWRGAQPYADYPMRRICSVQLSCAAE